VLPALLDISQNVSTALAATTHYRQRLGLEEQLAALQRLREQLVNTPHHAFTFGQIVDQWRALLTGAIQVLTQQQQDDAEIPPVYVAGSHLRPQEAETLFKGRHALFTEIENLLRTPRPPVLVLHGQRRTGKTSLLAYLPQRLPAHLIPVTVNLQRIATAESNAGLVYEMSRDIVASARQGRNLQLREWPWADFQHEPFITLSEWLQREVEQVAPQRKFLLCLDEFERLDEFINSNGSRAILNFLRSFVEHRQAWTVLFAGSHLPGELAPHWSDTLINTRRLQISYLTVDEARELIETPTPDFRRHMTYEVAAVDHLLQLTRGQPYLIQLLCLDLINHLNQAHRHTATAADVAAIIDPALDHGGNYFDEFWHSATPAEQAILSAIAHGHPPPADAVALRTLCQREVLEQIDGAYRFQVPLIARWVKQRSDL
jgi:hypothetical protein